MILQGRSAGSTTERSFRWNFLDLLDFFLLPKGRSDFLPKGRSDATYKEVFGR